MEWTRRAFLKAGAGAVAGLAGVRPSFSIGRITPPNLLIIHTDQLSSWALSCYAPHRKRVPNYGKVLVETPHIDRLAEEGARLDNFFTNSAVCTPSRGCLFTGRYPHCHGAYKNDIELNRDEITLAHVLKRAGFETGYGGKWHLDGIPKPGFMKPERSMGFDDCRYMFNRGHWKRILEDESGAPLVANYKDMGDEKDYTTDYLADRTVEFVTRSRTSPFFYVVSFPDPHTPFTVREPYMSMYDPGDMVVPNTWMEEKGQGKKKKVKKTKKHVRGQKARYCGLVKCIDDNVGKILDALEEKGLLDDTIVAFTTDHGEYMGEHNLWGKNRWYRTAYRIPFLVRWPEKIKPNTVVDNFITNVDVQQTLLGLMKTKPCDREQGRDASPLLRGEKTDWEDVAWIHHSSLEGAGIFTREYELILKEDGEHMLFDRKEDPEQTRNLAFDPEYAEKVDTLGDRIKAHHRRLDSPASEWL